jgi:AAA15 family ATPase/GTPase
MIAQQKKPLPTQMMEGKSGLDILKAGIIYGANASGKSNLVKALGFMKEVVINGLKDTLTFNKHFRLEKGNNNKPSLFEVEFQYQNKVYNYGFAILLSKKIIVEEWFYELNKNSQVPIFERQKDEKGNIKLDISLKFGKGEKNQKNKLRLQLIGENLADNQLFLTEVSEKNIKNIPQAQPLLDAYKWFDDVLMIVFPHSKFGGIDYIGDSNEMTQTFCKFLDIFNTGINGLESKLLDFEKTLSYLPNEIKVEILKTLQNNEGEHTIFEINGEPYITHKDEKDESINFKIKKLMTKHRIKESEDYELFEINREESDGTRRIFDFIPALLMLANQESIFVIDEIDRSLHPILTKNIVDLFLKNTVGIPSQLIVTTHESSLLDLNFIRKDEIWFMEKNEIGESNLYSLDEFKPRADRMQIRKDYLLGRFGAIPFIANIEDLGWLKTENE